MNLFDLPRMSVHIQASAVPLGIRSSTSIFPSYRILRNHNEASLRDPRHKDPGKKPPLYTEHRFPLIVLSRSTGMTRSDDNHNVHRSNTRCMLYSGNPLITGFLAYRYVFLVSKTTVSTWLDCSRLMSKIRQAEPFVLGNISTVFLTSK